MTCAGYAGGELELFERAHHWKAYLRAEIAPFLRGDVLEVGAGLGATTRAFAGVPAVRSWTCLEPDPQLCSQLTRALPGLGSGACYTACAGTLLDLGAAASFDTALYVDVLEHIERDADELSLACARLRPGGHLVVLSPAHDFLMSAFDRSIGHHRRYDRRTLAALTPAQASLVRMRYLDSVGMLASLANRALLRQALPTHAQIALWDRRMVPVSRAVDRLFAHRLGKSILAVWQKR